MIHLVCDTLSTIPIVCNYKMISYLEHISEQKSGALPAVKQFWSMVLLLLFYTSEKETVETRAKVNNKSSLSRIFTATSNISGTVLGPKSICLKLY